MESDLTAHHLPIFDGEEREETVADADYVGSGWARANIELRMGDRRRRSEEYLCHDDQPRPKVDNQRGLAASAAYAADSSWR